MPAEIMSVTTIDTYWNKKLQSVYSNVYPVVIDISYAAAIAPVAPSNIINILLLVI